MVGVPEDGEDPYLVGNFVDYAISNTVYRFFFVQSCRRNEILLIKVYQIKM